jgi:hypothetical protein
MSYVKLEAPKQERSSKPLGRLFKYIGSDEKVLHSAILENTCHFTCPLEFNDPFDCLPVLDMASTPEQRIKAIRQVLQNKGLSRNQRRFELAKLTKEHSRGFSDEKGLEAWNTTLSTTGVLSLSERSDSILMWSHYADKHQGICLGYDPDYLPAALFPVQYLEKRPVYHWSEQLGGRKHDQIYEALCTKDESWSYEKEWRVINRKPGIEALPAETLRTVVIGQRASEATIALVRELAKQKGGVEVLRSTLHSTEFKMVAEQDH